MKHEYMPQGVCPMKINFELDGNTVHNVEFLGGCNGNLKAISTLIEGWDAEDVIAKLAGNTCGFKSTSCADQLSKALVEALSKERSS